MPKNSGKTQKRYSKIVFSFKRIGTSKYYIHMCICITYWQISNMTLEGFIDYMGIF